MTEWVWLNDEYRAGTVYITADPTGKQGAIAEGLRDTVADRIVKAHNASLRAAQGAAAPPQRIEPLAVMIGDFARDFVDAPERMAAIDRLYSLVNEARRLSGASTDSTEEQR